jgi:HAD superfamily hydrolase (TIGR01509 family)
MPHRPEAVVFDLGKVLLDFDFSLAAKALAPATRLDAEAIRLELDQSPLLHDCESGRITSHQFFQQFVQRTGYRGTESEFRTAFGDIFTSIDPMLALHAELRARGVPTYIFSNTNDIAVEHIRSRYPFFREFDGFVFSYEVGAMKPQPRIYAAVEAMTGRRGTQLLYLDDRAENVEAGAARGWQTILHCDPFVSPGEVWRRLGPR